MKSRPFLRLMWSPQAGFLVLPLTLAASWPIVRNHPSVAGLGAGAGVGPDEILWGESVIFAVVAGFMSGLITRDVLQAPFAFLLPSLRTRILLGKAGLALLIAAALGYLLANAEGFGGAVPIAACALFFFALGASLSDPLFPKTVVWIVGPLLVIPVWEPAHVQRFFEFAPIIGSVAALGAAIVLGLRELDTDTSRIRTLGSTRSDKDLVTRSAAFAKRVIGMTPVWRGNPRDGRTADWVEAVHYENFGSRPFEWPTSVVWAVGLNCGMAYAL